jgi:hypothetical protein
MINEVLKFLTTNPTTLSHSIMIADPTNAVHPYTLLLQLEGAVCYFEYSFITSAEYKNEEFPHLEVMTWDPYDKDFATLKESLLDFRRQLILPHVMVRTVWQGWGQGLMFPVMRNPTGNIVQFHCSMMLPMWLRTITLAWPLRQIAKSGWCAHITP